MPIRRFRDSQTGESFVIDWAGQREPTDEEVDAARAQQQPPRGMEPPGQGRMAWPSPSPNLTHLGTRQQLGLNDESGEVKELSDIQPEMGYGKMGLSAIRDLLYQPVTKTLGMEKQTAQIDAPRQREYIDDWDPSLFTVKGDPDPEATRQQIREGASRSRGFVRGAAEAVTPAHIAAAASLPSRGLMTVLGNATLAGGGAATAADSEASTFDRTMGGVEAVAGAAGMGAGWQGAKETLRGMRRAPKPEVYQFAREGDMLPPNVRNRAGGLGTARTPGGHRITPVAGQVDRVPIQGEPSGLPPVQLESPLELADRLGREIPVRSTLPPQPARPQAPLGDTPLGGPEISLESALDTVQRRMDPQINLPLGPDATGVPYGNAGPPTPYRAAGKAAQRVEDAARLRQKKEAADALQAGRIENAATEIQGSENLAEGLTAEARAYNLARSTVRNEDTRNLARTVGEGEVPPPARQAPPTAGQADPTSPTPPPTAAPPTGAPGAISPDITAALEELGITPEMASRLTPEDLIQLIQGYRRQTPPAAAAPAGAPRATSPSPADRPFTNTDAPSRIDEALRGNPDFQALPQAERARRYRELGGLNAESKKLMSDESGQIDPLLFIRALGHPGVRAGLGAGVGYTAAPEGHELTGGLVGGLAGLGAGPGGGRQLNRLYYESMLAGPAQIANVLGNTGTILTAPLLEASRGNIRGARRLAQDGVLNPEAWKRGLEGLRTGWNETRPVKYTNELPQGPMGRTLNAVDRGTKNVLQTGGMSPEMAGHYTFTADPQTELVKGLQYLQQRVPGFNKLTPFIRTIGKQAELGAAHSPLRHLPTGYSKEGGWDFALKDTFPVQNPSGRSAWLNPYEYTAMMPGTLAGALGMEAFGETPGATSSPHLSAIAGGLAAPYQVGRGFYDYMQHGEGNPQDFARTVAHQIPIASDFMRLIENPSRFPGQLAQRFIPPAGLMVGDKTVRDPRGENWYDVGGYIQERLPWERENLPVRPDFFGQPQERTWYGGLPEPLYERDPRAAKLAEMGLLRYQQSPSLGDADLSREEVSQLQTSRGQGMMQLLDPILRDTSSLPEVPDFMQNLPADQAPLAEEFLSENGAPRSQADLVRLIQRLGIRLGTEQFRAQRLAGMASGQ